MNEVSHDALNGDSNIPINESHNLLFKLYANLLMNPAVQNGIRQISRLSQPIRGRIDDSVVKLTTNVSKWVSHENIYNHLASLWLHYNFPYNGRVTPYQEFSRELESAKRDSKSQERELAFQNFYQFIAESWKALRDPTLDDLKNCVLEAIAKSINKSYHFQDETVANALYNMLRMLIEKRRELVSSESFLNLIRVALGEEFWQYHNQAIKAATHEYYVFAKRFVLIDFPLATNNKDVLKLILNFVQDNSFYYGDSTLTFIEKRLDAFLKLLGQNVEQNTEDHRLADKAQRILRKIFLLSTFPLRRIEDIFHQIQNTKTYTAIDNRLHINDRIDDTIYLTAWGYNLLKENILEPSFDTMKFITNKAKSTVTVVMHGLDVQKIRRKYRRLHAKYEVLQKCAFSIAGDTANLIFDKTALAELGENGKRELTRLYQELKGLEGENIKRIGLEYYANILKKANKTYTNAQRAVYYRSRELGDQDGANAIRPQHDSQVDAFDNDSHHHNFSGRNVVETIALETN